jgi:ankyrin repeat protein
VCFVPLGHYEAVRLLLSRGVDVDALNFRRVSPLQLAAGKGHDQAVKILLEHGADVSCYILPLWSFCTGNSRYLPRISSLHTLL